MKKYVLGFFMLSLIVAACSSSDDSGSSEGNNDTFDRAALLINLADNIIIPAFQDLNANLATLKTNTDAFVTTPNATTLQNARAAWLEAYTVWQNVEMFNIGEAENIQYGFQMNVYPTNVADIEANVSNGNYDLTSPNNNDAVGFPALDYLLYGVAETDALIIETYEAEGYKNYLSDLVDQMQSLTTQVLNDWTSSYRAIFISQTDNTATSALNKFTNDYIFYYEKILRANKIGIPAGVFSAGEALPDRVEGLYSKVYSKTLALEAMDNVVNVFNGKAYNSDAQGESFRTYLTALGRTDVVEKIDSKYDAATEHIEGLDASFFNQINTNNVAMTLTYDALQAAVVDLKVNMLSAFNISLDFVDADGD